MGTPGRNRIKAMRNRTRTKITLARLSRAEEQFMQNYFLAPVVRGYGVRVKILGVVCEMRIDPPDFRGWGVFLPISHKQAMLDRPATLSERRRYLELFPSVQLVVTQRHEQ